MAIPLLPLWVFVACSRVNFTKWNYFEISTAVVIGILIVWAVKPCSPADGYERFRWIFGPHLRRYFDPESGGSCYIWISCVRLQDMSRTIKSAQCTVSTDHCHVCNCSHVNNTSHRYFVYIHTGWHKRTGSFEMICFLVSNLMHLFIIFFHIWKDIINKSIRLETRNQILKWVVAVKECIRGGGRHLQDVIFKHW